MYNDYFGFKEAPFSIAPDPQFLYMSDRHREALAHLLYGMKTEGGFVLLTGEVGTGKTTVCRCLLEQIPENSEIAFVLNPKLTATELLATICDELRIDYPQGNLSNKVFIDAINGFLLAAHARGCKTVLIIDEAQNLSIAVLEQIRLLTNLETNKQKLLQVIMLGQPELKLMLDHPELRQFAQRITARYHLEPLAKNEIQGYLSHRLFVAGVERPLFPAATVDKLYQYSNGVPRVLNLLCDRALLGAYVKDQNMVSPALLVEAAREVFGEKWHAPRTTYPTWQWVLVVLVVLVGSVLLTNTYWKNSQPQVTPAVKISIVREAPPLNLSWESQESVEHSSILAYQHLFNAWGLNFDPNQGSAQEQAEKQNLNLLSNRGSLGRLRQLDRPAVLKLVDVQGQEFYATLVSLNSTSATLLIGELQREVSLNSLNQHWLGEYALLWRMPSAYRKAIKPGATGAMPRWLERQMARLGGRAVRSGGEPVLDGLLLQEVQDFQTAVGLEPDGIVGNYTLILLNTRLGHRQPSLSVGPGG